MKIHYTGENKFFHRICQVLNGCIQAVSVNGKTQEVTDNMVDITVPQQISQLTDDVGILVKVDGYGLSQNDFTDAYKDKLDRIAENANDYTHPTASGNKHIPSGGSSGQILRWSADGTAVWGADNNTTYENATQSASGLLSTSDKTKLDSIETGANKITVDTALSNTSTNPVQNKAVKAALDEKAAISHGTHVTYATAAPKAAGTASAGSAANVSRGDHVHPAQTSVSGNAGTATKLQTARTFTLSQGLIGSVAFDGSANVTLNGSLKQCYQVDESTDFSSYAWHKIADVTLTAAYTDISITFLVSKMWGVVPTAMGILTAHIRTKSTKIFEHGQLQWLVAGNDIDPSNFILVYTNTENTSVKVELWYKQTTRYDGWSFTVLKEYSRTTYVNNWKLYSSAGHGSASRTSGTGEIVSSMVPLSNSVASATKVQSKVTKPTTQTTYYPDFHTGLSDEVKDLLHSVGNRLVLIEGTASTEGLAIYVLGDSTKSGTAGNKTGVMRLYGYSGFYGQFKPATNLSANRTYTLPNKSGTLVVASDLPVDSGWKNCTLSSFAASGTVKYRTVGKQISFYGEAIKLSKNVTSSPNAPQAIAYCDVSFENIKEAYGIGKFGAYTAIVRLTRYMTDNIVEILGMDSTIPSGTTGYFSITGFID